MTFEEQIAEGDKGRQPLRLAWDASGEFFGVPPTGRQVTVPGVVIDRIVAGKMKESRILMDTLSLMQHSARFHCQGKARTDLMSTPTDGPARESRPWRDACAARWLTTFTQSCGILGRWEKYDEVWFGFVVVLLIGSWLPGI
jgi:hypothetical protein